MLPGTRQEVWRGVDRPYLRIDARDLIEGIARMYWAFVTQHALEGSSPSVDCIAQIGKPRRVYQYRPDDASSGTESDADDSQAGVDGVVETGGHTSTTVDERVETGGHAPTAVDERVEIGAGTGMGVDVNSDGGAEVGGDSDLAGDTTLVDPSPSAADLKAKGEFAEELDEGADSFSAHAGAQGVIQILPTRIAPRVGGVVEIAPEHPQDVVAGMAIREVGGI